MKYKINGKYLVRHQDGVFIIKKMCFFMGEPAAVLKLKYYHKFLTVKLQDLSLPKKG